MIKRTSCILLCVCMVFLLPACAAKEQREISCEEVAAAYEQAGYSVFHNHSPEIDDWVCYLAIENEDGNDIYFHFHETDEEAEAHADGRQYNGLIWLFSVIYGDPTWVHTTTYRNIEIEYTDKNLYAVFEKLIN